MCELLTSDIVDADYRKRLRAEADAGNRIAERLLLLHLLADHDLDEIEAHLEHCSDANHQRFLAAELRCFHGWPGIEPWQDLLRESALAGHREAQLVVSHYHAWARNSGHLPKRGDSDDCSVAGWCEWSVPDWMPVISGQGLVVERSTLFAPPAVVAYLRALLGQQLRPSAVIDPDSGQAIAHPVRINRSAQWLPEQLGWVGKLFECRLAEAAGFEVAHGEVPSLLHYGPGQRYKPHLDCISSKQAASAEGIAQGGQRTLTILLAMGNEDLVGGETYFPQLKSGTQAATGQLLRFNNTDADGQPLRSSLHEGRPITAGEKWLLSKWVREQTTPYGREICLGPLDSDQ